MRSSLSIVGIFLSCLLAIFICAVNISPDVDLIILNVGVKDIKTNFPFEFISGQKGIFFRLNAFILHGRIRTDRIFLE